MEIDVKGIVQGHYNQVMKVNQNVSGERLEICNNCPLCNKIFDYAWICNPRLWIDPKTGEVSTKYIHGYRKGCGCNLKAKTTLPRAKCPGEKW